MPGGRPSKFDPKQLKAIEKLCQLGATDKDLAEALEVEERTIHNWKKDHPEFFHAIKKKDEANEKVKASLFQRACGYSHPSEKIFCQEGAIIRAEYTEHYPPDTAAAFIWLKNRDPDNWRDKQEVEHSGDIKINVSVEEKRGSKPQA